MNNSSNSWSIFNADDSSHAGCDLVRQWLREHNWQANPEFMKKLNDPAHEEKPLVLLATEEGAVIGGLLAATQLAWLRISIMAVHPERRSEGLGGALLAEAERQARERGCSRAYVDTMEYQAPRFYLAHGYSVVGELADWDSAGHSKFFLTKRLEA